MTAVKCLIFSLCPSLRAEKKHHSRGGGLYACSPIDESPSFLLQVEWCNYSFNDPAMERQCGRKKKKGRKKCSLRAQQASTQSALLPSGDLCIQWSAGSSLPTVWKEKVDGRRRESRAGRTSEKVKGWGGQGGRLRGGNKPVSAKTRAWGERRAESAKDS